jgi:hypothetical protein
VVLEINGGARHTERPDAIPVPAIVR